MMLFATAYGAHEDTMATALLQFIIIIAVMLSIVLIFWNIYTMNAIRKNTEDTSNKLDKILAHLEHYYNKYEKGEEDDGEDE